MKKKVIIFCEGKILHRELASSLAIRYLMVNYDVLAVVDKQSKNMCISTIDSVVSVYGSVKDALYQYRNEKEKIYLLLGLEDQSELLLLTKNTEKSKSIN